MDETSFSLWYSLHKGVDCDMHRFPITHEETRFYTPGHEVMNFDKP